MGLAYLYKRYKFLFIFIKHYTSNQEGELQRERERKQVNLSDDIHDSLKYTFGWVLIEPRELLKRTWWGQFLNSFTHLETAGLDAVPEVATTISSLGSDFKKLNLPPLDWFEWSDVCWSGPVCGLNCHKPTLFDRILFGIGTYLFSRLWHKYMYIYIFIYIRFCEVV